MIDDRLPQPRRRVHLPAAVIPKPHFKMSKLAKPRALGGQGAGVYKPEAIRVSTDFFSSLVCADREPTGHCGIPKRHGLAGCCGFRPRERR